MEQKYNTDIFVTVSVIDRNRLCFCVCIYVRAYVCILPAAEDTARLFTYLLIVLKCDFHEH